MAIHFSILTWRILKDRVAWQAAVHEVAKNQASLSDFTFHLLYSPVLTTICDHWEDHSLDWMGSCCTEGGGDRDCTVHAKHPHSFFHSSSQSSPCPVLQASGIQGTCLQFPKHRNYSPVGITPWTTRMWIYFLSRTSPYNHRIS